MNETIREMTVEGRNLKFSLRDRHSQRWFARCTEGQCHEPAVTRDLIRLCGPGKVFVDVGAHLGYFSCLAAAAGATVFALEMQPVLAHLIQRNVDLNGFANVHVLNAAAAESPGLVGYRPNRLSPSTGIVKAQKGDEGPTRWINAITLDLLFREQFLPDVLKVDVEGYEVFVLRGARHLLKERYPTLFLEVHARSARRFGYSIPQMLASLLGAGYSIYRYVDHRAESGEKVKLTRESLVTRWSNEMVYCVKE